MFWSPQPLCVHPLRVKTAVVRKEESVSSLRKQYQVSEGAAGLAPCPGASWHSRLPLPVLCCRRLCREPTAWRPSWSSSGSSSWPPNEPPGPPTRTGERTLTCAWGWGRAPPLSPVFPAWCRGRGLCRDPQEFSGCFDNKSLLVSTAATALSVSPG